MDFQEKAESIIKRIDIILYTMLSDIPRFQTIKRDIRAFLEQGDYSREKVQLILNEFVNDVGVRDRFLSDNPIGGPQYYQKNQSSEYVGYYGRTFQEAENLLYALNDGDLSEFNNKMKLENSLFMDPVDLLESSFYGGLDRDIQEWTEESELLRKG